jgi:hypothetical protein
VGRPRWKKERWPRPDYKAWGWWPGRNLAGLALTKKATLDGKRHAAAEWRGGGQAYTHTPTLTHYAEDDDDEHTLSGIAYSPVHHTHHIPTMSAAAGPSNPSASSSTIAQKTFELNNDMITLDPNKDAIFHFDNDQQKQALNAAPWKKE